MDPEIIMVMEITNKDIKAAMVNRLYMFKKVGENMTMIIREGKI